MGCIQRDQAVWRLATGADARPSQLARCRRIDSGGLCAHHSFDPGRVFRSPFVGAYRELEDKSAAIRNIGLLLAAIFGLPFVIWRSIVAQRQVNVSEQGLITDRINKAVDGLGTEKTVSYERVDAEGRPYQVNQSKPNIDVRIGAIYALERIAKENLDFHVQIMEILCAYIRENAPASEAEPWPEIEMYEDETDGPLRDDWEERVDTFLKKHATALQRVKLREDIKIALQIISRRTPEQKILEARAFDGNETARFVFDDKCPEISSYFDEDTDDLSALERYRSALEEWKGALDRYSGYRLDLRGINLRGAILPDLNLNGALFDGAQMQGAALNHCEMQGASLYGAQMQAAQLDWSQMQTAVVNESNLQLASFGGVSMQEASLSWANLRSAKLSATILSGTKCNNTQMQWARLFMTTMNEKTALENTGLSGAHVIQINNKTRSKLNEHLRVVFGDASTLTPNTKNRPAHWPKFLFSVYSKADGKRANRFDEEWREWLELGDAYEPPTEVDEANGVFPYVEDTDD